MCDRRLQETVGLAAAAREIARKEYQLKSRDHARLPVQVSRYVRHSEHASNSLFFHSGTRVQMPGSQPASRGFESTTITRLATQLPKFPQSAASLSTGDQPSLCVKSCAASLCMAILNSSTETILIFLPTPGRTAIRRLLLYVTSGKARPYGMCHPPCRHIYLLPRSCCPTTRTWISRRRSWFFALLRLLLSWSKRIR